MSNNLHDLQLFSMEFARLCNVTFSHEMRDRDRRAYWEEVLEPAYFAAEDLWYPAGSLPRESWEAVILGVLAGVQSPSQWRAANRHRLAAEKALRIVNRKAAARRYIQEKTGVKFKDPAVNTKAFWQGQSFGAASEVRRIDPSTYKIED